MTRTILIKPASSLCNMVCSYCFYDEISNCRTVKNHGIIQENVWHKLVDDAFMLENVSTIIFAFQGGEPLLAGFDFFEDFVKYTQDNKKDYQVEYTIQTNGVLITEQFCHLFKKHNFLLGISIDGFKKNHNKHRHFRGVGSFDDIYKGLNLLKENNIPFNVLTVLTKELAKQPQKLYQFYQHENISYVQIIPCMADFNTDVTKDLFACTPASFEHFYLGLYDEWIKELERGIYRSILLFNDIVSVFMGNFPQQCGFLGNCIAQTVVESNGSVYPCDFYVLDEWVAGSLLDKDLRELINNNVMQQFVKDQPELNQNPCQGCPFKPVCNGGCKRLRTTYLSDTTCGLKPIFQKIYDDYSKIVHYLDTAVIATES